MGNAEYMGVQFSTIMKSLILLALAGLVHAEVVVKELHIHEGGTVYTQTITLDFDRNIQILEVPAHNDIVHSKTIFDFNQGIMIESHPEAKLCYMKDIPVGIVSMEKFGRFLDDKKGTIEAAKEHTTRRAYKTVTKVNHQQLSALATEVVMECAGSTTSLAQPMPLEDIEISYSRAPNSLGDFFRGDKCNMPERCMWQTCQIGSDSCWWTVNCDVDDEDCSGALEHSSVIHNCPNCNIHCTPCFNKQCEGCPKTREDCHGVFTGGNVGACPDDPELGKDCGQVFCPMHEDIPNGNWHCPAANKCSLVLPGVTWCSGAPKIKEGQTCMLFCSENQYGGSITCQNNGTWMANGALKCD